MRGTQTGQAEEVHVLLSVSHHFSSGDYMKILGLFLITLAYFLWEVIIVWFLVQPCELGRQP